MMQIVEFCVKIIYIVGGIPNGKRALYWNYYNYYTCSYYYANHSEQVKEKKTLYNIITQLEREKNLLINVPVLNELSKVEALVKNNKLEEKYNTWKLKFEMIEKDTIPTINDMLIEVDFMVTKGKTEEIYNKVTEIEIKLYEIKTKIKNILSEIKEITSSEEKNRATVIKLKSAYRKLKKGLKKLKLTMKKRQKQ